MSLSTGVSVIFLFGFYRGDISEVSNTHVFAEFHIIVCGLDSIIARRWMNGMLVGRTSYILLTVF